MNQQAISEILKQVASHSVVSLAPLAPVIVRSGKPSVGQTRADPARLPPPSTIAGCLRTAWARARAQAFSPELLQLSVAGPLLLRGQDVLVPKPADALYFGQGDTVRCVRAQPQGLPAGCGCDLPKGLLPVRLVQDEREKSGKGPTWWRWQDLLAWRRGQAPDLKQGYTPPPGDRRTHVALDAQRRAALEGRLFQTEGLDLAAEWPKPEAAKEPARPAVQLLACFGQPLAPDLVRLGGEQRLAALHPEADALWPTPPDGWLEAIVQQGGLSLTLLTPGLFEAGFRPAWLDAKGCGSPPGLPEVQLRLVAAAVERWQPQSGWDLAAWAPRQTRKLVPAGAVYWFECLNDPEPAVLQRLWLGSVCDAAQDRLDGFGLVLPAAWKPVLSSDSK